ncbi:hypothetical protein MKW92_032718 [Papaver armeniacum]|nr:hypothetical protein MKW92_032718 [Papaver armeniacum]
MSAIREFVGDDPGNYLSYQDIMLGLLKVLVDSQAKQAESHAITLHQIATTQHQIVTTQHQMMEILKSSNTCKNHAEKHKVVKNPSLWCSNQPVLVSSCIHNNILNLVQNFAVNMNMSLSSISVYEEEIIQVIPDDLNGLPFEHRQQLQLSDLAGHQTIIDQELQFDEEGGQVVNKFALDGYEQLYEAAVKGDWGEASKFLEENPEAITKAITRDSHTVLDLAVSNMVDLVFVKEIVRLMPPKALENKTAEGYTPLHYAAVCGYAKAAELIVAKNPKTTQICGEDYFKMVPLLHAVGTITVGQKETVEYLYSVTRHEHPSPFSGRRGAGALCRAIDAGFNDVALSIVQRFPRLVTERTERANICGLELMAERPFEFASGRKLTFWQRCFYSSIQMNIDSTNHSNLLEDTKRSKEKLLPCLEGTNGDEENPLERFEGTHTDEENPSYNSDNTEGDN